MRQVVTKVQPATHHLLSCGHNLYTFGDDKGPAQGEAVDCKICDMKKKYNELAAATKCSSI